MLLSLDMAMILQNVKKLLESEDFDLNFSEL